MHVTSPFCRRSFIGGTLALLLVGPTPASSTNLETDTTLLRLEFLLEKLKVLRKVTKNILLQLLLDAAIEIATRLYEYWRQQPPTPAPIPEVDPTTEASALRKQLEDLKISVEAEQTRTRELLKELYDIAHELKRKPRPYHTCGPGMSRRPDGTCRDHTRD